MSMKSTLVVIGAALSMLLAGVGTVSAQSYEAPQTIPDETRTRVESNRTRASSRQANARQQQAPAAPDPAVIRAEAQAILTTAGATCEITEVNLRGRTADQIGVYETVCAGGPGYILIGSTPPMAIDCVLLSGQAAIDRARDPAADVGTQCALPANADIRGFIATYAKAAGVSCDIDEAISIGKSSKGAYVYEVGCRDQDGFWIEQAGASWAKTECIVVVSQSGVCKFTTPQEQAMTLKTRLAGSPAEVCDVQQARYMGANANGAFFEAKCGAGDGYIVRLSPENAVQQTYPCAEATRIGGGCTLTTVAAATPPATAPATQ